MRTFIKIFSTLFLCAPFAVAAAPVSQPAGSNLTQYNGSMGSIVGNQWNNALNPRNNAATPKATADFGNCNSLILRCASPKCSGGGCANMDIAKPIVAGCVNSNANCKKHGDDLINAIAAQLVSDSIAAQNAAAANAAAAQSAAEQNNTALQQQLQSMQQQMASMQQQNSEQINSLQQQLAESQRETQNAVASVAESASRAATAQNPDTGLTPVQEAAAKSGVSDDVIARATITGQILTSMEGVDKSLNNLKTTMRDAFRYAKCNEVNGNNCSAPKRVAKFRELANKFMEPYDALADNLDDALFTAQSVGVDLGNIYMFFSGSCNRWAEYVCRGNYSGGLPVYSTVSRTVAYVPTLMESVQNAKNLKIEVPTSTGLGTSNGGLNNYHFDVNSPLLNDAGSFMRKLSFISEAVADNIIYASCGSDGKSIKSGVVRGGHPCADGMVIPPEDLVACTVNRILDANEPAIQEKILNPDQTSTGSVRIGCASDGINSGLIKRRRSSSKNKSGIDIDLLEIMLNQDESSSKFSSKFQKCDSDTTSACYCGLGMKNADSKDKAITQLKTATVSKTLGKNACIESFGSDSTNSKTVDCYDLDQDVSYVDPVFALCDTHVWNAGLKSNDDINGSGKSEDREKMNEIIALKTTVIAQQMYKQYATLEQMIKQLKVMLEKEVLKASVQVAGGTSSDTDTTDKVEFSSCSAFDDEEALSCLRDNYAKLQPIVEKGRLNNNYRDQLSKDCAVLEALSLVGSDNKKFSCKSKCSNINSKQNMQNCLEQIAGGINALNRRIKDDKAKNNSIRYQLIQ